MEITTRGNTPFPAGDGKADTSVNKAAANAHGVVDKMAEAADDAARKVKPAIDRVAQMAHQGVDKAADAAGPAAAWLSERGDSLMATKRKVAADTCQYVSANPWKSVGFALAAGFLISRLMR